MYLYAKDLSEPKYGFLEKRENAGIKRLLSVLIQWMMFMRILMITI